MPQVILEAYTDESFGQLGLGIIGTPRNYDTNSGFNGLIIAHDIMEHVNGLSEIGTIDDELEALGAIWYIRGQHSDISRDGSGSAYTAEENIASDVVRMYRDHVCGDAYVDFHSKLRTRVCDADEALNTILDYAADSYKGEFSDSELYEAVKLWPQYRSVCLHRMRTGYRKAYNKWEPKGRFAANSQFWAIAEAVDPYAKRPEYEGMRYKLNYGKGEARCTEDYQEDYY
jgi:hypothetical protein